MNPLEVLPPPPSIPGFPNILQFLWALLVAVGAWVLSNLLRPAIGALVAHLPGFLSFLGDKAHELSAAVERVAGDLLGHAIAGLVDLLSIVEMVNRALVASITHALESAFNALNHLQNVVVPFVTHYAEDLYNRARAFAQEIVADWASKVEATLAVLQATLLAAIEQALSSAVNTANNLFRQLDDQVSAWVASLTAAVAAALGSANAYTDQRVQQAEAVAADATQQAEREIQQALTDARGYVDQQVAGVTGLTGTLIGNLERSLSLQQANDLARALAATGAVAVTVEAIRELECIKRCAPLGTLGKELEALDLAALLALLIEVAHDPRAAETALQATLTPVVDDGVRLLRGVLGR